MTCAAYYGHTDVIKELIENGADVNLVSMGHTACGCNPGLARLFAAALLC
jgi:hypothetical protein